MKFGKLIQKQDPVVGQGDFSGLGVWGPASCHTGGGCGMVRGPEGAGGEKGVFPAGEPHDGMDFRGFQGFRPGHRREDGGKAPGGHALAGSRRTD